MDSLNSGLTGGFVIYDSPSGGILPPTVVNAYTTLSIPAYWRAIEFTSQNMASFPRSVTMNGADVPHRLDPLLKWRPNTYQSAHQFWETLAFHDAHYRQGFAEIKRDSQFNVTALETIIPEMVSPFRYTDEEGNCQQYYFIGGNNPRIVTASDIIHLSGLSYNGMTAFNPIWLHAETFERSRLLDRYVTRYLTKGTVVRGSIEIPAGATQDQQETIVHTLRKRFQGPDAESDVLVLSDGAHLNNATLTPQESELLGQAALNTKQISQITGIPCHFLMDDSEGKYNGNVEAAGQDVVRYHFRPKIERWEDELSLKLLTDAELAKGYRVHIDPNALIRGDTTTESNVVTQQVNAGVITKNEGRELLGFAPSNDPEANKLKTLGDTAPPKVGEPTKSPVVKAAAAQPPNVEHFRRVIDAAADRVGAKTSKATTAAQSKFKNDAEGWTRWGNVFATEQAGYAAEALEPILETIEAVTGQPVALDAIQIGEQYAAQLRGHFAKLNRGEDSTAPDLSKIIFSNGGTHEI